MRSQARIMRWALCLFFLGWFPLATAQENEIPNECHPGSQGEPCTFTADCQNNEAALVCIDSTCQIPCQTDEGEAQPYMCSLGETCVQGISDLGPAFYCQPSSFTMDLNLLDSCIVHFLQGAIPDLSSQDLCSLERNLNRMLDQNLDNRFDIFDVDLCVRAFLQIEPCDTDTQTCPQGQVYCESDQQCGEGLFCNLDLYRCERECGFVSNREENLIDTLERECFGRLKTCDYYRGRCVDVDLTGATCQVDADCPAGAYCFLGDCLPRCYRSIECPDSNWYCSATNTCLPKPRATGEDEEPFDPKDYTVQLARKQFSLDPINSDYRIPLLIMSQLTKKQVFDDPSVVFGYRMEVHYARKQSPKCFKPTEDWSDEEWADCLIDDKEEFVTLANPFGTIYATGDPTLDVLLNTAAVDRLTPGLYEATITAIFNNGTTDSATVSFRKTSPSGTYTGRLSIYVDGPNNLLGNTNLGAELFVDTEASMIEWHQLLADNNLDGEEDLVDITAGYPVTGYLQGNDSMVFNWPPALEGTDNQIPIKGIYAPHLRRMRLIAVIDLEADHCRSEDGECDFNQPQELRVQNVFGRKIRRLIQFLGPFDAQVRLFHGMYRETISGLAPHDITLDGGFRFQQSTSDDTPIGHPEPLLDPENSAPVGFTDLSQLLETLGTDIDNHCGEDEKSHFADRDAFQDYLAQFDADGGPIYPDLVTFAGRVGSALNDLAGDQDAYLTINDFLRGQIFFCSDQNQENCVDEQKVLCGLALYRKAILSGWVDLGDVGFERDLFCSPVNPTPGCSIPALESPSLVTLQEHNRFYQEAAHALTYQAGNELSDAFFVLYRASNGDDLGESGAYSYKEDRLYAAWQLYDRLREVLFSSESTALLYNWPMRSFDRVGADWLENMHTVIEDRLDALAEMVDLKRRVFQENGSSHYHFAQHLLHEEFLTQVYLITLQKSWEEELFAYTGTGERILDSGAKILAKVNETRNPLGLQRDRIYFENSNLNLTNWQNYCDRIKPEVGTGLLQEVEADVQVAIANLKAALQDRDTFENSLLVTQQQLETTLEQLCGPPDPLPPACDLSREEQQLASECTGPDCLFDYMCDSPECDDVIQVFDDATGDSLEEVACRLDTQAYKIRIGEQERLCVRGQLGVLQQEKVMLELQRKQVYRKVRALLRQIASQQRFIRETMADNQELIDYLNALNVEMIFLEEVIIAAEAAQAEAAAAAEALDCWAIVGMANGTNCPQKQALAAQKLGSVSVKYALLSQFQVMQSTLARTKEIVLIDHQQRAELRRLRMELDNLVTSVENHISEYEVVTQQLFNLDMRIQDTHFIAQQTADRYSEQVANLVNQLIGRESGSVLLRNRHVQAANRKFQKLLLETYKMAQAFIHRYNMHDQAEAIANRVYRLMTTDDVDQFVDYLIDKEENYCALEGLDCDWIHNPRVFRFSLRDQLFPTLHDIVDAKTGKVLTKGQQFHNIITSSTFIKRRKRAGGMMEQIEIPFAIWLNDRGDEGGAVQRYLVSPNECNHLIAATEPGSSAGTLAVNALGTRIEDHDLTYEMWRGDTDYIRSCDPKQVTPPGGGDPEDIYPIFSYIAGYAPVNPDGEEESPSFFTRTAELPACRNDSALEDGQYSGSVCFYYFARDRSLGAPDWKLVIPRLNDENANQWILGEGLSPNERPIIEDIVLYIRHSGRPIMD